MLYSLFGTNRVSLKDKAVNIVNSVLQKNVDVVKFSINNESSVEDIKELVEARGLFSGKHVVLVDVNEGEVLDFVVENAKRLNDSEHLFVLITGSIDSSSKKKLERNSKKVEEREERKVVDKSFDVFGISNAWLIGDKKNCWKKYIRAINSGVSVEEIQGVLFWQARVLVQALSSGSQSSSGLKPFVYSSAKKSKLNLESARENMLQLSEIYSLARTKGTPMEILLERFVLGI